MNEKIDVIQIMESIEKKANERRLKDDVRMLENLDLKNLSISDLTKQNFQDSTEQNDYLISQKIRYVKLQRKGLSGKVLNFGLRKFYYALRYFLDGWIVSQEKFNTRVSGFLDKFKNLNGIISDEVRNNIEKIKNENDQAGLFGFDYVDFENKFRGDSDAIVEKQKKYLKFFKDSNNVLDIGCGSGDFLGLLKQERISCVGLDTDISMIEECKKKDLNVQNIDALDYFSQKKFDYESLKIDGVFCSQVVEHLEISYLIALIKEVFKNLQSGAFFVIETINIKSLSTFTNSVYLDPTHKKPIHPETLKFLLLSAGFSEVSFIFSSEFSDNEKLQLIKEENERDRVYNENIRKLNELLFAPQDYAVVAKK